MRVGAERHRLGEIHADFFRRVRVRAECNWHMIFKRELEQRTARINFFAIFPGFSFFFPFLRFRAVHLRGC